MPDKAGTWLSYLSLLVSLMIAFWVFLLLIEGGHIHGCRYYVPVKHHTGVYTCSNQPRPARAR